MLPATSTNPLVLIYLVSPWLIYLFLFPVTAVLCLFCLWTSDYARWSLISTTGWRHLHLMTHREREEWYRWWQLANPGSSCISAAGSSIRGTDHIILADDMNIGSHYVRYRLPTPIANISPHPLRVIRSLIPASQFSYERGGEVYRSGIETT